MNEYLAIDIGASSGRHILGRFDGSRITLEEIHRFDNGMTEENGRLVWDLAHLTEEVIRGIEKCGELGVKPVSVAIDTWGVDYLLLDCEGKPLLPAVAYRDGRTVPAVAAVAEVIPDASLYARTGIQKQSFNTIYQLVAEKGGDKLSKATRMLLMPDYLGYVLTGVMEDEYTIASTTGLLRAETGVWDDALFEKLGLPRRLVGTLHMPGTPLGPLKPEIAARVGFDAMVVHAAEHDTGSAVAACPIDADSVYLSSGTWSLIGCENPAPVLTDEAREANFTNEGGVEKRYRFLKNLMGMWLFQSIRRELDKKYTYDEMMEMAMASSYEKTFSVLDDSLNTPKSMIGAIRALLGEDAPLGDVIKSAYLSLAHAYDDAIREIESMSGKPIRSIMIVGGGSKDRYLNRLTAEITGKRVLTGLTEATALGNLISQIMCDRGLDLTEARKIVKNSFPIKEFV